MHRCTLTPSARLPATSPPLHFPCACYTAGEVILGDLYRSGFTITDVADEADAIVVNTCGFVEDAKAESLDVSGPPLAWAGRAQPGAGWGVVEWRGAGHGWWSCHTSQGSDSATPDCLPCAPRPVAHCTRAFAPCPHHLLLFPPSLPPTPRPLCSTTPACPPARPPACQAIIEAAQMKEEGRVKRVVVTGCLAQRYSEELAEQLPEADLVVGFQNYGGLAGSLRGLLGAEPEIDFDEYRARTRVQVRERDGAVCVREKEREKVDSGRGGLEGAGAHTCFCDGQLARLWQLAAGIDADRPCCIGGSRLKRSSCCSLHWHGAGCGNHCMPPLSCQPQPDRITHEPASNEMS